MIVEFKEGERKRTIHKMDITYEQCNCILQFGTIKIGDDNYEIINAHLNNLHMFVCCISLYCCCVNKGEILPDAEIYVQKA